MNESIPPELDDLFRAELTGAAEPTVAQRERVLSRLESTVAAVAVGTAAGAAGAVASGSILARALRTLGALVRGKATAVIVAASVGVAGGGAVAYRAGERAEHARATSAIASAAASQALRIPTAASLPPSSAAPVESVTAATDLPNANADGRAAPAPAPAPARASAERDAKLAEELGLIQRARTALMRGDAAGALDATNEHRRSFPSGRLAEERESVAIQALARLGRADEARRRAADFERKYPDSVFLPVVARAVRSIP